tara:strand:- start:298 stop:618 length:321 start_codon:yes stop_codon:yes gene_type:complete
MKSQSFFYSDRQNRLIEKAAISKNPSKRIKTLATQFNRPYNSLLVKAYKIRLEKGVGKKTTVKKLASNSTASDRKEKFVTLAQGTVLNFTNIKKAEMHDNHVRIYF